MDSESREKSPVFGGTTKKRAKVRTIKSTSDAREGEANVGNAGKVERKAGEDRAETITISKIFKKYKESVAKGCAESTMGNIIVVAVARIYPSEIIQVQNIRGGGGKDFDEAKVSMVQRLRVFDSNESTALLSINPCDVAINGFSEGDVIILQDILVDEKSTDKVIELKTKSTSRIDIKPSISIAHPQRTSTQIQNVILDSFEPDFHEFDTVGVVVAKGSRPYGLEFFDWVCLASPHIEEDRSVSTSFLAIFFSNGTFKIGNAGEFAIDSLVACKNLEWRGKKECMKIPASYYTKRTCFSHEASVEYAHLRKEMQRISSIVSDNETFRKLHQNTINDTMSTKIVPTKKKEQSKRTLGPIPIPSMIHSKNKRFTPLDVQRSK